MHNRARTLLLLLLTAACTQASTLGSYKKMFAGRWVGGKHGNIVYKIHAPKRVSSKTSLPVVIYLHGSAKNGTDNIKQTKVAVPASFVRNMKQRPCILIAPQSPPNQAWTGPSGDSVISLVDDLLKQVSVADRKRVYLTGFSLGAVGTWYLLDKRPDLFAAAVPLAGAGKPQRAARLKGIDIWIFHGRRDKFVPVTHARAMRDALKAAGIPPKYSELPEGHLITSKVFNQPDVHNWLFQQRRQ